jgi:hypothetical protein
MQEAGVRLSTTPAADGKEMSRGAQLAPAREATESLQESRQGMGATVMASHLESRETGSMNLYKSLMLRAASRDPPQALYRDGHAASGQGPNELQTSAHQPTASPQGFQSNDRVVNQPEICVGLDGLRGRALKEPALPVSGSGRAAGESSNSRVLAPQGAHDICRTSDLSATHALSSTPSSQVAKQELRPLVGTVFVSAVPSEVEQDLSVPHMGPMGAVDEQQQISVRITGDMGGAVEVQQCQGLINNGQSPNNDKASHKSSQKAQGSDAHVSPLSLVGPAQAPSSGAWDTQRIRHSLTSLMADLSDVTKGNEQDLQLNSAPEITEKSWPRQFQNRMQGETSLADRQESNVAAVTRKNPAQTGRGGVREEPDMDKCGPGPNGPGAMEGLVETETPKLGVMSTVVVPKSSTKSGADLGEESDGFVIVSEPHHASEAPTDACEPSLCSQEPEANPSTSDAVVDKPTKRWKKDKSPKIAMSLPRCAFSYTLYLQGWTFFESLGSMSHSGRQS